MHELCIGYLTDNRRMYTFEKFIYFLNKITNKDKVHLLVLINNAPSDYYENIIKTKLIGISSNIVMFNNNNNYINKINAFINYSKQNNIKYCMKCDNDIIINNHTIDYMIENLHYLEKPENLFITPSLSTGIPTTDYFVEDFFNEDEQNKLHNIYLKTNMPNSLWGFDYSYLNDYTIKSNKWEVNKFINKLNELDYHYKGIHPIRIDKDALEYMNNTILKYKAKIHDKQDYKIQINSEYSYLCNSIFIISAQNYANVINNRSLYVDPYDEVPVNKYCRMNNMKGIYIRNSFTIHPIYNTISNHPAIEQQFYRDFFTNN